MKKIGIGLVLVFLSFNCFGLSGDGSENNGYRGSLRGNTTFGPNVVFITGNISTDGYTLFIAPGTTLRISAGVQIEVNAGKIVAVGTNADPIVFSARETSWGHINHSSTTGGTVFEFCTFENGFSLTDYGWGGAIMIRNSPDVHIAHCIFDSNNASINGGALYAQSAIGLSITQSTFINNTSQEGGALFLTDTNAEITACTFEGNSATKADARGGAIFIHAPLGYDILIDRCKIHSNTSAQRTGGIHFDTGSGGTIQNSLIYGNYSSIGGGVNMGSNGDPTDGYVNIINSLIAENTPCDVAFRTSNGYSVRNSIIWGSDNSVMYNVEGHTGQDPLSTNLINCAVQGATDRNDIQIDIEHTFINSFKLNSLNSQPDGPNFKDPLAHDYRIEFISPCRDQGISEGSPAAPLTDYLGNERIGDLDIGAFEVQYSRWLGSVSNIWSEGTNWDKGLDPSAGTGDVIIPSGLTNYPSGAVDQDFTVDANKYMILEPGALVTLDDLINNGRILIKSSYTSGSGSIIVNDASLGSGTVMFERSLPQDGSTPLWHYVSSPVSLPGLAVSKGLYPWNEPAGDWGVMTTNIEPGIGYTSPGNSYISFTGSLNTSEVVITATSPYSAPFEGSDYFIRPLETNRGYGGGGWNLLGNPYASAINVTEFIDANYSTDWQISLFDPNYVALYLYNGNTYQYVTRDETGWRLSWPNGAYLDTKYIQAGQAFFVLAMNNGVRFGFLPSMREHATGVSLLKSGKAEERWPGLALKASNESSESRTFMVFNSSMNVGLDPGYDIGYLSSASEVNIYTALVEDNGVNFAMQALPEDGAIENIIPVGIDFVKGGKVTFSADTEPFRNYKYWLEDRAVGSFIDLATNTYSVDLPARTLGTGRFFIHVTVGRNFRPQTSPQNLRDIRIWTSQNGEVHVQGAISDKAFCEVFDTQGHIVYEKKLSEGNLHTFTIPEISKGIYLVRVTDGVKATIARLLFLEN